MLKHVERLIGLSIAAGLLISIFIFGLLTLHADTPTHKSAPKTGAPVGAVAPAIEIDDLVKQDLTDIKKDCPTCTFLVTKGYLLNVEGDRQETAVVYVWHPGTDLLFIRARHLIYNVVFIFLPNGTKEPELKKFLARPPEVKK
jgi:formate/nitrite transporter FocA (FNT family)